MLLCLLTRPLASSCFSKLLTFWLSSQLIKALCQLRSEPRKGPSSLSCLQCSCFEMQCCFASAVRLLSSPRRNNDWTKCETLIFHCFSCFSSFWTELKALTVLIHFSSSSFWPSWKRSKSLFTSLLLPFDRAQSAQSPYSLLFLFLWMAQPGTSRVIASTCNQQRDHLNQTLFPLWGFEVLSLSCPEWTHSD